MPEFLHFKTFEQDSISDGSEVSGEYTPTEDIILKRIYIIRKDGASLTGSTFYFKVPDRTFTKELVPASLLGPDPEVNPELNISVPAKTKIEYTFKNNEGTTISIFIVFECWKP